MCGIFGIVYRKPTKLNKIAFNIMGIENDSRGGDSCGIFIDGRYEYGVGPKKLYDDFYEDSEVLSHTRKCTIALGHCRKASVGAINESTAQPVIIKNPEDDSKVDFVLIHNGTIYNYKELAAKYIPDQNIENLTDSQVFARIFYYAGYDVLKEYRGAGVFVSVDYRSGAPELRIFQGESKAYESATGVTRERPLYFIQNKECFVFSSLATYLPALFPFSKLMVPTPNMLICLKDGKFTCEAVYDRKESLQTKPVSVATVSNNTTTKSTAVSPYYGGGYYGGGYYDEDYPFGGSGTKVKSLGVYIYKDENNRFKVNGQFCEGYFDVDNLGFVRAEGSPESHRVWFWNGVLLKNEDCFDYLDDLAAYLECDTPDVLDFYPEIVAYLSPYPLIIPNRFGDRRAYTSNDGDTIVPYNGKFQPLFDTFEKEYQNGILLSNKKYCHQKEAMREYLLISQKAVDFSKLSSIE